ncbi:uncharacterized protein LOC134255982 [Saccostrea cucullata]|uniref:uncharacterized protein LOC134255982 n=1 Tax=Saccostrea cuccullata TaxID=36930 RepID=UPI002ED65ECB
MEEPNFLRICLLGHSFVTRLRRYMDSHPDLMNLKLHQDFYSVSVRARGGLRISSVARSRDFLTFDMLPHVCFMQIGENDILLHTNEMIVRDILSLASYLHSGIGIQTVIVGQLLRRQPWASSPDFNERIIAINVMLREQCSNISGVHFWPHRGFWTDLTFLCQDGVHLRCPSQSSHVVTTSPMHRFWRSVRSAILQHRHISGQYHSA